MPEPMESTLLLSRSRTYGNTAPATPGGAVPFTPTARKSERALLKEELERLDRALDLSRHKTEVALWNMEVEVSLLNDDHAAISREKHAFLQLASAEREKAMENARERQEVLRRLENSPPEVVNDTWVAESGIRYSWLDTPTQLRRREETGVHYPLGIPVMPATLPK